MAGTLADLEQLRRTMVAQAKYEISILESRIQFLIAEFRRFLESWLTLPVAETVLPHALTEDLRVSHMYGVAAVAALVGEICLASWFFYRNGTNWIVGGASVLVITLIFHAVIYFTAYGSVGRIRPRQVLHNLRFFVFPAATLFLTAVVLATVPRYLSGPLAANQGLHNLFSAGLLIGTISMLLLSSALGVASFVYAISQNFSDRYIALKLEVEMTRSFLDELEQMASGDPNVTPTVNGRVPTLNAATQSLEHVTASTAAVVLLVFMGAVASGCSSQAASADSLTPREAPEAGLAPCEIDIDVDTSGSALNLAPVWLNFVKKDLKPVLQRTQCGSLVISTFAVNGWLGESQRVIDLPMLGIPARTKVQGEWAAMANVREAEAEMDRAALTVAKRDQSALLDKAVAEAATIELPSVEHETRSSDLVGLLKRYSRYQDGPERYIIVFSDFGDSRKTEVPPIQAPPTNVHVIGIVLPMKEKDARLLHLPLEYDAQFDNRAEWLSHAAPWVRAVPFFHKGVATLYSRPSADRRNHE